MKIPISVLVVIYKSNRDVLLIERADRVGFWQSVTGSLDAPDEDLAQAATREVYEETGIVVHQLPHGALRNMHHQIEYEIYPSWRFRYAPGVTRNIEHWFSLEVPNEVSGRGVIVKPLIMFPIECVARGYLTGSGWVEYQKIGSVCGIKLPSGLQDGSKLPEPIFTPATKAEDGMHDENISYEQAVEIIGESAAAILKKLTLALYTKAHDYALTKGIILADTKFEFGELDGELILIDEVLTPDSSRFWPADQYRVGISPPSFDKQYVRDYLETLTDWGKTAPAPALPAEVIEKTQAKYFEAIERLTGEKLKV